MRWDVVGVKNDSASYAERWILHEEFLRRRVIRRRWDRCADSWTEERRRVKGQFYKGAASVVLRVHKWWCAETNDLTVAKILGLSQARIDAVRECMPVGVTTRQRTRGRCLGRYCPWCFARKWAKTYAVMAEMAPRFTMLSLAQEVQPAKLTADEVKAVAKLFRREARRAYPNGCLTMLQLSDMVLQNRTIVKKTDNPDKRLFLVLTAVSDAAPRHRVEPDFFSPETQRSVTTAMIELRLSAVNQTRRAIKRIAQHALSYPIELFLSAEAREAVVIAMNRMNLVTQSGDFAGRLKVRWPKWLREGQKTGLEGL